MADPLVAQKGPYEVAVAGGRSYFWCACGRSRKQPYCDGSHAGAGIEPVKFTPAAAGPVWLCGCKRSKDRPYCDGTHNTL